MPGKILTDFRPGKRKRHDAGPDESESQTAQNAADSTKSGRSSQADILLLEEQILASRKYYNNIVKLQKLVFNSSKKPKTAILSAVALCRVFCRFIARGDLNPRSGGDEDVAQVSKWLKQRLQDYVEGLTRWLGDSDAKLQSTALTLLMRIVKEQTSQQARHSEQAWRTERSTFYLVVVFLLGSQSARNARQEFAVKFANEYDDVRFYTLLAIKQYLSIEDRRTEGSLNSALDLLEHIVGPSNSDEPFQKWYGQQAQAKNHQLLSPKAHQKAAQECWLTIFRSPLTLSQRKTILNVMKDQILPCFTNRMELLTDFLTDSFNEGGSVSLLALSGIFYLMTERNLDYPDFYTKLYSLLDEDVLHSKHRSRFFRLLDQFMASTHLPAAMVASFIKRLARLSLQAPPGAVVWIVPWTYNLLRRHPACTFMLHRPYHPAHTIYSAQPKYSEEGVEDPFDAEQTDPMLTHAIDSSLWELHTLSDHWHPNVATLARILGEQFTKQDYQLEDFLDHSYATLVDAELRKEVKKQPEVEWEIQKRIVTDDEGGLNELGSLLWDAM